MKYEMVSMNSWNIEQYGTSVGDDYTYIRISSIDTKWSCTVLNVSLVCCSGYIPYHTL